MNTNVNLAAPIGALALLGTGFLFAVAVLVLVQSLVVRKVGRAKVAVLAIAAVAGIYFVALLAFSLASHEHTLARGQEKHFCELDCHLAYSIVGTRQAKQLEGTNQSVAQGQFTIITIRTRFDPNTTSANRGDGLLYPNSRRVTLIDEGGHSYSPTNQTGTPITTPLRPGDSYITDFAFDLPANVRPVTLLVNEESWDTRFIIGHENSFLHKKTKFQVG